MSCHFVFQGTFPIQGLNPHLQDWQGDSLPLHHQGSLCLCSAHVYKHAFREASRWEAKHHGKKPHMKKNKAWVAGWGEEECKLQESFSLTNSAGSSPERYCSSAPTWKGGRKGDYWRQKRKGAREAEPVCGVKSPLPRQSRGQGFTVCHVEFHQSPPKRSGWGVWLLKFYASHFPLLALRVPGCFHQSAFCGHFSCWECWSNQTGGRGDGEKGRALPWRRLIDGTQVGSKLDAIHLLWLFVDHVC